MHSLGTKTSVKTRFCSQRHRLNGPCPFSFRQSHGRGAVSPHRRRTPSTTEGTVPTPCHRPIRCMAHASARSCRRLPCPPTDISYRPSARASRGRDPLSATIRRPQSFIVRFLAPGSSHTPPLPPRPLCSASSTLRRQWRSPEPALPPSCSTAEHHPPHLLQPSQMLPSDHNGAVKLESHPFLAVVRVCAAPPPVPPRHPTAEQHLSLPLQPR